MTQIPLDNSAADSSCPVMTPVSLPAVKEKLLHCGNSFCGNYLMFEAEWQRTFFHIGA